MSQTSTTAPQKPAVGRAIAWYCLHRLLPALAVAFAVVGGYFGFWRYHLKRFHAVDEGALYRAAQPTEFGFRHLAERHGVRTVVNVRLEDPRLYDGLLDPGQPSGEKESQFVPRLGVRHLEWPMGEEAYWPWLTPWQFEQFFELFDNPDNLPVMVHCLGGRHRTGTFSALYQLEYLRLPAEQVVAEMLSYDFGTQPQVQDHNLRTYTPRPRPDARQWKELAAAVCGAKAADWPADYQTLVRQLRHAQADEPRLARLREAMENDVSFALCLAQRVIDSPDHILAEPAAKAAAACLDHADDDLQALAMSAAIVADYGTPDQQRKLIDLLESEPKIGTPTPRYRAVVAGVTNRFTPNRIAYLLPLLADTRPRVEPAASKFRYCDTAVAHLVSITDEPLFDELKPSRSAWNEAVARAATWFDKHPDRLQLARLLPPTGKNRIKNFEGQEIDGRNFVR
jgi:hypothetical protein